MPRAAHQAVPERTARSSDEAPCDGGPKPQDAAGGPPRPSIAIARRNRARSGTAPSRPTHVVQGHRGRERQVAERIEPQAE